MLIARYEEQHLLFNSNFTETMGEKVAYRGELVLVEGEVADAQGRRKPPEALLLGAVLLEEAGKLAMLVGLLNDLAYFDELYKGYSQDFADNMVCMLFVRNIKSPMQMTVDSRAFWLIPHSEGVPWNEAIDELCLEKSDFKGQSPGEKLVTLCEAFRTYRAKGDNVDYQEAMTRTVEVKIDARGPV